MRQIYFGDRRVGERLSGAELAVEDITAGLQTDLRLQSPGISLHFKTLAPIAQV